MLRKRSAADLAAPHAPGSTDWPAHEDRATLDEDL
jgi:hypothetical protein